MLQLLLLQEVSRQDFHHIAFEFREVDILVEITHHGDEESSTFYFPAKEVQATICTQVLHLPFFFRFRSDSGSVPSSDLLFVLSLLDDFFFCGSFFDDLLFVGVLIFVLARLFKGTSSPDDDSDSEADSSDSEPDPDSDSDSDSEPESSDSEDSFFFFGEGLAFFDGVSADSSRFLLVLSGVCAFSEVTEPGALVAFGVSTLEITFFGVSSFFLEGSLIEFSF